MMKFISHLLFASCLLLSLQSCWIVGVGNSCSWDNAAEVGCQAPKIDSPKIKINLSRPNSIIPIPFFLFVVDKKKYSLSFVFDTRERYVNIDSLKYSIISLNDSVLFVGCCKTISRGFYKMGDKDDSYFEGWAITPPDIDIMRKLRKDKLKVSCSIYLKKLDGEQVVFRESFIMSHYNPRWFHIELFNI